MSALQQTPSKNPGQGATDPYGNPGPATPGAPGIGVPAGGTTGQALVKNSNTAYDTIWATVGGGLSAIANNTLLANTSGISAVPVSTTVSALLDAALGSTQGQIITRNGSVWTVLNPSTGGKVLQENGAGANLSWVTPAGGSAAFAQGRLTTVSGNPTPANDQIAVTTLYWTPYKGNLITLWDGAAWTTYTFSQITLALGTLVNNTNYDVYAYQVAGVVTLEIRAWRNSGQQLTQVNGTSAPVSVSVFPSTHGATTGDTAYISQVQGNPGVNGPYTITVTSVNDFTLNGSSATGLTTNDGYLNIRAAADAPTSQDGRYCKSSDKARLYLGTFRTTSTTTTEDSQGGTTTQVGGKRFVWNYYNRVDLNAIVIDTTAAWSYTTQVWRQANGAAGNKIEYVCGMGEDIVSGSIVGGVNATPGAAQFPMVGFGLGTTANGLGLKTGLLTTIPGPPSNIVTPIGASISQKQPTGYSYVCWCEMGSGGTAGCFFQGGNLGQQAGMQVLTKG